MAETIGNVSFLADSEQRACASEDPEQFFPQGRKNSAAREIWTQGAKAICQGCVVVEECGVYALETGQDYGVWGGMSEDERSAIKRRNARATRRTG